MKQFNYSRSDLQSNFSKLTNSDSTDSTDNDSEQKQKFFRSLPNATTFSSSHTKDQVENIEHVNEFDRMFVLEWAGLMRDYNNNDDKDEKKEKKSQTLSSSN